VLIFRYSVGAAAASSLMELWAAEAAVAVEEVAHAIVYDICQGSSQSRSEPWLVRWVEDRIRQEVSPVAMSVRRETETGHEPEPGRLLSAPEPVVVAVDHSDVSLDAVVAATRRAAALGVPLQLTVEPRVLPEDSDVTRAHLVQRIELAAELAQALEPGLAVLLPADGENHGG
jgi:hypothetical protein